MAEIRANCCSAVVILGRPCLRKKVGFCEHFDKGRGERKYGILKGGIAESDQCPGAAVGS